MNALAKIAAVAAVDAALAKAYAPMHEALADISSRLNKIDAAPLPLWLQATQPHNEALVDARQALSKAVGASPAMTDADLLARLLADPAVAARAQAQRRPMSLFKSSPGAG